MAEEPKIYFITGVCGVGKSTVIPYLKSFLRKNNYDVRDFDERGVPSKAGRNWRIKETEHWVKFGKVNLKKGISTFVCGFSNPEELKAEKNIGFILLDAGKKTIAERITKRYQTEESIKELKRVSGGTVEKFIENNTNFSKKLKNICLNDERCAIINTINILPEQVARQIVDVVKKRSGGKIK